MSNIAFPAEEFIARRTRLQEHIAQTLANASVLVQGAGPVDGFTVFRQTNEFYYLTGLETPQALLLISNGKSALYLPPSDSHAAGEGGTLGAGDADAVIAQTGVDAVYPSSDLAEHLPNSGPLFTPLSPAEGRLACQDTLRHAARLVADDPWETIPSREQRLAHKLVSLRPNVEIGDLSPILNDLRLIKSPREIEVMRKTGALCGRSVAEAMRATQHGVYEYQLGAIADYVYRVNGARGEGYRPIIAAGENIWYPHYYRNDAMLRDGDLVLMDYAPDLYNYTNDIGRLWPINGTYSPIQKTLYGFIVEYHKALLTKIRPGVTPRQVLNEAAAMMVDVIAATKFQKPIYEQAARRTLDFAGHLSHPVGMAVHDVGTYVDKPMEPGLVFALDPQLWVPEEQLYIRVEDTVAVTHDGVEILTTGVPFEIDEIEALMQKPGILQEFPMGIL